jgi:hypothetical protein
MAIVQLKCPETGRPVDVWQYTPGSAVHADRFSKLIPCPVALGLLGVSSAATLPLAGSLDPAFGSGGMVTARAGGGIGGISVQPDGKIVVAGTTKDEEFLLARYLPNGSQVATTVRS